jgi:hypothetical protein
MHLIDREKPAFGGNEHLVTIDSFSVKTDVQKTKSNYASATKNVSPSDAGGFAPRFIALALSGSRGGGVAFNPIRFATRPGHNS